MNLNEFKGSLGRRGRTQKKNKSKLEITCFTNYLFILVLNKV